MILVNVALPDCDIAIYLNPAYILGIRPKKDNDYFNDEATHSIAFLSEPIDMGFKVCVTALPLRESAEKVLCLIETDEARRIRELEKERAKAFFKEESDAIIKRWESL